MRRHAEINENALDPVGKLRPVQDVIDVAEVGLNDVKSRIVWCLVDSIRITVDTDDTNIRISVEQRTAVSSPTESEVDDASMGCRLEPGQHLWDHHRYVIDLVVWCGLIHGQPPGALAPKRKRAE